MQISPQGQSLSLDQVVIVAYQHFPPFFTILQDMIDITDQGISGSPDPLKTTDNRTAFVSELHHRSHFRPFGIYIVTLSHHLDQFRSQAFAIEICCIHFDINCIQSIPETFDTTKNFFFRDFIVRFHIQPIIT